MELLEEYHAELFRPTDVELKFSIEKLIGIFKTNLFSALCGKNYYKLYFLYKVNFLIKYLNPIYIIYYTKFFKRI